MSAYVQYTQVSQPELLDVVDDAWAQDKLPNDGQLQLIAQEHALCESIIGNDVMPTCGFKSCVL